MSRIKPTEIKDGDSLQSSTINQTQSDIRGIEIARPNVRQEGLTADVIKSGTVFDSPNSIGINQSQVIAAKRADAGYKTLGPVRDSSGTIQNVTITNLDGADGEKVIIRASCRIYMDDYGARTFNDMLCPVIDMRMRRAQVAGLGNIISAADPTNYSHECDGTRQSFELAWSGKIPSSSVGQESGVFNDISKQAHNTAYVGTGGDHDDGVNDYNIGATKVGRCFDYDFVYQTSWLFDPTATDSKYGQVHFALFGFADVRNSIAPSGLSSMGEADGAGQVNYNNNHFKVLFLHMSALRIRR